MLSGVKQGTQVDREEVCLARVAPVLGHLAGAEFIKEAFGGDSKVNAENIIQGIIETFKKRLETISWMDKESSEAAIGKVGVDGSRRALLLQLNRVVNLLPSRRLPLSPRSGKSGGGSPVAAQVNRADQILRPISRPFFPQIPSLPKQHLAYQP